MVAKQRDSKPSTQRRKTTSYKKNSHSSGYRSYQPPPPPRLQPQKIFYQPPPPPIHNNYGWQSRQPIQQQINLLQAPLIPWMAHQYQFQPQPPPIFYNNPPPPLMQNWVSPPIHRPMPQPYRRNYYEQTPVVPIKPDIVSLESPVISENESLIENKIEQIESEIEQIENLSTEAVLSSNNSYENDISRAFSNAIIFDTTERPGPKEVALPKYDLNDPVLQMNNKACLLTCGDKIERPLIPKELTDGNPFGLFIVEVNSPAKFWFHLKSESLILDELMFDLE